MLFIEHIKRYAMSRSAIAILSTQNLLHNLDVLKNKAPGSDVIAMVKANAYGHGLRSVSQRLQDHIASLGVASIDEALALRKAGVTCPITLCEGVFEADELLIASCQRFHVVFHEENQLRWLEQSQLPVPLKVWLKIDSGMGRLGFNPTDGSKAYERLKASSCVAKPIGLMSHFACSEDKDHPLNLQQIETFETFAKEHTGPKSFLNSGGIFHFPQKAFDAIRPGLALYGVSPMGDRHAQDLGLKPVMTLQTRLIAVKNHTKGSFIGYGARYQCPEDMPVGVIAMGYGDGYPRTAKDGTPILVNGKRCQIVGRVSMDMATIDLRQCPQAQVGDPVTLWGDGLAIEEVATHTQNIPYDILTGIQSRVVFHWTLAS